MVESILTTVSIPWVVIRVGGLVHFLFKHRRTYVSVPKNLYWVIHSLLHA